MPSAAPPPQDIEDVVRTSTEDLRALADARLMITGGTGFVGTWLVHTLVEADRTLALGLRITVLSRAPDAFAERLPDVAGAVEWIAGDVLDPPALPACDIVVHAATPAVATLNDDDPDLMYAVNVDGMRNLLRGCGATRPRLLFTSSGAIYGPQPTDLARVPETYADPHPDTGSPYARGKRDAERLAIAADADGTVSLRLARLFAFAGPLLPLDGSFAIGNFIGDALAGRSVVVQGDGTAVRSYLYAGDLVRSLLAVLARGDAARPYNVGSDDPIAIGALARRVRDVVNPDVDVEIVGRPATALPTSAGSRYVPDCTRLREELRVRPSVGLDEAILRTARWAAG